MKTSWITTRSPYVLWRESVIWTRIDFDWWVGYQCVDLIRSYMAHVLWINKRLGNANQARANTFKAFDYRWTRIKWTKDLCQWDIIVRWTKTGYHIAIFDRYVGWEVVVLEQNGVWWWTGKGGNAIRLKWYRPSYRTGVWRNPTIAKNYQQEVVYIKNKLLEKWEDQATLDYLHSIRFVW